jgi:Transposase DDE domain
LLGLAIRIPDHSTMSRRAANLANLARIKRKRRPDGPVHLLVDSTGLKVLGAGEWQQEKQAIRPRRTWRAHSGEGDRLNQPKVITGSGDRDHVRHGCPWRAG